MSDKNIILIDIQNEDEGSVERTYIFRDFLRSKGVEVHDSMQMNRLYIVLPEKKGE